MRQVHRAGEKLFTDFAGKKPHWIDPQTGEVHEVELFVAVLGASNFTYAEALGEPAGARTGSRPHARAGVLAAACPALVVPDQLKRGGHRAVPLRARDPAHLRGMGGALRHGDPPGPPGAPARQGQGGGRPCWWPSGGSSPGCATSSFFSLAELNARIAELLEDLNARVMRRYGQSRRELFEQLERPALKPLPPQRFTYAEWSAGEGEHRLPRARSSTQLLLGALSSWSARSLEARVQRHHRGALPQRRARRGPRARHAPRPVHAPTPAHMPSAHRAAPASGRPRG